MTIVRSKRWNGIVRKTITFASIYVCAYVAYSSQLLKEYGRRQETSETMHPSRNMMAEIGMDSDRAVQLSTDFEREGKRPTFPISQVNSTVLHWEGLDNMSVLMRQFWNGTLLCKIAEIRSKEANRNLPILINVTFGCMDMYENWKLGTGNYILLFYGVRVIAQIYGDVDVSFTCMDADETKNSLVTPWLVGMFPGRPMKQNSKIPISSQQICKGYFRSPISYMHKEIQNDLRKMAIGLLGIPRKGHPSTMFAETSLRSQQSTGRSTRVSALGKSQIQRPKKDDIPLLAASKYELDDAVLHFRCGDLMDSDHPQFAFMKFSGYTRHISPEALTIGIITQPFEEGTQSRSIDMDQFKRDRCRIVVYSLVKYIEERHPNAKVSIRNSIDDTIALSFARMIMANQTINGISTFSIMPTIATFGTGYIRKPEGMQNGWLMQPRIDAFMNNIVLFDEPNIIKVRDMKKLWENEGEVGVLNWFWDDSSVYASQN